MVDPVLLRHSRSTPSPFGDSPCPGGELKRAPSPSSIVQPNSPTDPDAEVRRRLAAVVPEADGDAAWAAYEEARIAGLCHEGAWEIALGTAASSLPPEYPTGNRESQT